jgi:DNA gyrase subunit B
MRGLIERGFLYIAQPPLYRLQRGNAKPVYLKDDSALEAYCIGVALRDAVFTQHDGGQRAGNDLRDLLEQARVQRRWLQPLAAKVGNLDVVEQAAIAGALAAGILADPNRAIEMAHRTADRLNQLVDGPDGRWQGDVIAGEGLVFSRNRQGVGERRLIDAALLRSSEARRLDGETAALREVYERPRHRGQPLQRPRRDEPGPALGDDARPRGALALKGQGQPRRRCRGDFLDPDGRPRRAAPRIHPVERPQRRQPRRIAGLR